MKFSIRAKRLSRSGAGDILILVFLIAGGIFSALPLVYAINNAFKPLNELFIFPPQFFVRHPTLLNFQDLLVLMANSWVPMSRYLFNSLFIVLLGVAGNVFFASLAAFVLAKHTFPGRRLANEMIILSLMFAPAVTAIPNYLTLSYLKLINTYWAVIIPSWASTLGLYLMKNFIDAMVPDSLLESARLDGAGEFRIYWEIVMPLVKPAWLTLTILLVQQLWGTTGGQFIYAEQLKPLPYALNQIIAGGIARQGVGAATALIMMSVPIVLFVINQAKIVQTMSTSGID